jgi:hypothetical protein
MKINEIPCFMCSVYLLLVVFLQLANALEKKPSLQLHWSNTLPLPGENFVCMLGVESSITRLLHA